MQFTQIWCSRALQWRNLCLSHCDLPPRKNRGAAYSARGFVAIQFIILLQRHRVKSKLKFGVYGKIL